MATKTTGQDKQGSGKIKAILFELDTVAVNGRVVLYETLKRVLKDSGTEIKFVDFSRYFLDADLASGLECLISDRGLNASATKLAERVNADMQAWAANGSQKLSPALAAWLKKRADENVRMGGLSTLGEEPMAALSRTIGLQDQGDDVVLEVVDGERGLSADAWLKLAKSLDVVPPLCVAVATSMKSVKSAVAAGMRCVAIEDDFNAFQDFGGAEFVVRELDEGVIRQVLELMLRD